LSGFTNPKEQQMNSKRGLILGTLLVAATTATGAFAESGRGEQHLTAVDLSKVQVAMSQAIATAEQQAGGKATKAKLENEKGKLLYEVRVGGKDRATEVKIDAQDGKVLSTEAAHNHGDHHVTAKP
jgi:uncharacterized membrane protein YkoI